MHLCNVHGLPNELPKEEGNVCSRNERNMNHFKTDMYNIDMCNRAVLAKLGYKVAGPSRLSMQRKKVELLIAAESQTQSPNY